MVRTRESLQEEYRQVTPRSRSQWEAAKAHLPGGVVKGAYWSPPYPIYMDRGEGCYLWDLDGRRYVDFANHHTAMVLGHSHPDVIAAVRRETERGMGLGAPTTLEAEIAEELTRRLPSVDKVRFTNSGTESSIHVTRLARAVTGRPLVAKFEGAYHGSLDALEISTGPPIEKAGPADGPAPVASWPGMSPGSEENVVILPYNQPESVDLILREHRDDVAAVFFDGKPGMLDIPHDFARSLRELTTELGMLMVMDEIVSFRVGYSGYQGLVGVKPDITTLGKIVGGGFPGSAIGGRAELMDVFDTTKGDLRISQSGTFSGNNFTLAAGLATLKALTPEVYAHLDRLREQLHQGLVKAFERARISCQVLSAGSIVNPFLTDQPVRDYRSASTADDDLFSRIQMGLALKGYYVGRDSMKMILSEPMQNEHVDGLVGALHEVLDD